MHIKLIKIYLHKECSIEHNRQAEKNRAQFRSKLAKTVVSNQIEQYLLKKSCYKKYCKHYIKNKICIKHQKTLKIYEWKLQPQLNDKKPRCVAGKVRDRMAIS